MSLLDAVIATGPYPPADAAQAAKKRYAEVLSGHLAVEVADGLRNAGMLGVKPLRGGPGERAFQGGLGPKKVDVTFSDERHGLLMAVSVKSICVAPFGKNLKNRFADLCTEAITLHMRFPYAVIGALFAFPIFADQDLTPHRRTSTFARATKLLATISGRKEYTDPGEKFENVTLMLFQPAAPQGPQPSVKLVDAVTGVALTEQDYFSRLRDAFYARNPHIAMERELDPSEDEA